jgi:hypothetical protein
LGNGDHLLHPPVPGTGLYAPLKEANEDMLPLTHVVHMTTIRRELSLPVAGAVLVRMNEKVQAGDVLAEGEPASRYYSLDLARALGVPAREAVKHVRRERGERVDAGDVLAGPVGVTRRTLRAPAAGEVLGLQDGRLIFEARGAVVALRASFSGVVVGTDGLQSVTLETTGALVQAVWGNGKQETGVMRQVASTGGDKLEPEQFDLSLRGAVLLAVVRLDQRRSVPVVTGKRMRDQRCKALQRQDGEQHQHQATLHRQRHRKRHGSEA